ncbi:hypothetical protein CRE_14386 [Caenorhabditis remanei]|uniref:Uncharacterized protein n=1 Tax=Caenorhabditis remanei TaxID=31234 RepID=E3NNM2_CAERE|nr:hypothetical protein CRE_14386 [Caenorhabditis remanei]
MKKVPEISSYDVTNLVFYVNGKRVEEKDVDPKMTLAAYLRDDYFVFHSPATPVRIRMACEDFVTSHVPSLPEEGTDTPWTASV